jgi:geranylgeranyl diphosphate synthase type II
MDISYSQKDYTEKKLHELILKKTGGLIIASVKTGALLGNASSLQLEAIVEYGENLGLAFQIRDDILDFYEESKEDKQMEPNYVSFFGLKKAEQKLEEYIETACAALCGAALKSEELKYLAKMLLIKRKIK